jgi:hypothetical protein
MSRFKRAIALAVLILTSILITLSSGTIASSATASVPTTAHYRCC